MAGEGVVMVMLMATKTMQRVEGADWRQGCGRAQSSGRAGLFIRGRLLERESRSGQVSARRRRRRQRQPQKQPEPGRLMRGAGGAWVGAAASLRGGEIAMLSEPECGKGPPAAAERARGSATGAHTAMTHRDGSANGRLTRAGALALTGEPGGTGGQAAVAGVCVV